jgi:hypothetical protein
MAQAGTHHLESSSATRHNRVLCQRDGDFARMFDQKPRDRPECAKAPGIHESHSDVR